VATTQFRDRMHAAQLLAERLRKYGTAERKRVRPAIDGSWEWEAGELPETYPWGV
jgi:hypothetical protein